LQQRKVELTFYEGQQVYIAFRHHDVTDMDRLLFSDVEVVMHGGTFVNDPEQPLLKVYPNPARTSVQVASGSLIREVSLFNLLGNEVYRQAVGDFRHQLNLGGLPEGIYLLRAVTETGTETHRIQVVR